MNALNGSNAKKLIPIAFAILFLLFAFLFFLSYKRMNSGDVELLSDDSKTRKAAHTIERCFEDDAEFSSMSKDMSVLLKELLATKGEDYVKAFFGKDNSYKVITLLYKSGQKDDADKLLKELSEDNSVFLLSSDNSYNRSLNREEMKTLLETKFDDPSLLSTIVDYIYYTSFNQKSESYASFSDFCDVYSKCTDIKEVKTYFEGCEETLALFSRLHEAALAGNSMNAEELAAVLGTDTDTIKLYLSYIPDDSSEIDEKLQNVRMMLTELAAFLQSNIMDNPDYSTYLTYSIKKDLNTFIKIADKQLVTKQLSSEELANLLGVDKNITKAVLVAKNGLGSNYSDLESFVNYLLNEGTKSMIISPYLDRETISQLNLLRTIITNIKNDNQLNYKDISRIFGFNEVLTKKLFEEKAKVDNISLTPDEKLLTIAELTSLLAKKLIYTQDKNLGFDSDDAKKIISMYNFVITDMTQEMYFKAISDLLSDHDKRFSEKNLAFLKTLSECQNASDNTMTSLDFYAKLTSVPSDDPFRTILFKDDSKVSELQEKFSEINGFFNYEDYTRVFISVPGLNSKEERKLGKELLSKTSGTKLNLYGHALVMYELHDKYFGRLIVFGGIMLVLLLLGIWFAVNIRAMDKGY